MPLDESKFRGFTGGVPNEKGVGHKSYPWLCFTPREYVDRVVRLSRENDIPAQYRVTGAATTGPCSCATALWISRSAGRFATPILRLK